MQISDSDAGDWPTLRQFPYPDTDDGCHEEEEAAILGNKFRNAVFMRGRDKGGLLEFSKVSLHQQADGRHTSPAPTAERFA